MSEKMLIRSNSISNNTLANLDRRDVALWVLNLPADADKHNAIISFLGLPWRLVLLESQDRNLLAALEAASNVEDALVYKRGFVQIIESNPRNIKLPARCLPIYLLNGRHGGVGVSSYENTVRRINMLDDLRQSGVRELLIISAADHPVPKDLDNIWSMDYRSHLTFVSDQTSAENELQNWLDETVDLKAIHLVHASPQSLIEDVLARYGETYPTDRFVVRMHDSKGQFHKVDLTTAEEIERPISDLYFLVQERDLISLAPHELLEEEFIDFFKDPTQSWRPFAAGLPWIRDLRCKVKLRNCLQKLDDIGPEENCIAYIASEPGAGGTTLCRMLALEFAREGYPVLVAASQPFVPDPLPIVNFLTRSHQIFMQQISHENASQSTQSDGNLSEVETSARRRFETPWIIVFDSVHWQHRDSELIQFRNALAKAGRPVCLLIITDTLMRLPFLDNATFKKIAELNHTLSLDNARRLGQHLNTFLQNYSKQRTDAQWKRFYEEHTVREVDGIAAFWVTLSFWIQGQYNFEGSIQEWIYRTFKEQTDDPFIQDAILQIAAMSSERLSLPQSLLPKMPGRWPVWQLIEDNVANLASLGLTQVNTRGERHWALIHDILGRLLVNALFGDFPMRQALGYAEATDSEHLRFLILRKISQHPRLGELAYAHLGEYFAQQIFKIDHDYGKNNFAKLWREVLDALNNMSPLLRNTNRVFRHHVAISCRRIIKLDSALYDLTDADRIELLEHAIKDIKFALLEIPYTGSEPDLNLLNSLALAYFDLAEVKIKTGAPDAEIVELKKLANETTLRAYHENPNNSFTIETYVRSLLLTAKDTPELAPKNCVAALGVLYSALHAGLEKSRAPQLGKLADQALEVLFQHIPSEITTREPSGPIDVLVQVWIILAKGRDPQQGWSLEAVPVQVQEQALRVLTHPAAQDNLQILHLKYDLLCNCRPYEYGQQLDVLEPLRLSESWLSPQLQLEYAILLFQRGRAPEGDRVFRDLRRLWQTSEQFVKVPDRLRWLRTLDENKLKVVRATVGPGYETRSFALVREFENIRVPFRPEEHGFKDPRPGQTFACYVSFGYNGPFLRPLSVQLPSNE